MALTRKFMQGMGLTEEQASAIVEANEETITGLKAEIEKYQTASEEAEKKLSKAQKELETIKGEVEKNADKNPYKVKYDAIKEEFEQYKADVEAKATHAHKESVYRALLKEAGISEKRIDSVIKVSGENIDSLDIDADGKARDKDTLVKQIANEWSDFVVKESKAGAETGQPPKGEGGTKMTKDEILAIKDTTARQQAMLENKELFL